jgi:hypothetical protein
MSLLSLISGGQATSRSQVAYLSTTTERSEMANPSALNCIEMSRLRPGLAFNLARRGQTHQWWFETRKDQVSGYAEDLWGLMNAGLELKGRKDEFDHWETTL